MVVSSNVSLNTMPQETWRGCHVLLEEGAHERGQPEGLTHSPQLWKVITIPNQYALPEYRHLSFGVLCIFRFSVNAEVPWTSDTSQFWKCSIFWQDVNVLLRISVFSFAKRGFVINFPTLVLSLLNLITLFFYPAAPASGAACVTFLRSVLSRTLRQAC